MAAVVGQGVTSSPGRESPKPEQRAGTGGGRCRRDRRWRRCPAGQPVWLHRATSRAGEGPRGRRAARPASTVTATTGASIPSRGRRKPYRRRRRENRAVLARVRGNHARAVPGPVRGASPRPGAPGAGHPADVPHALVRAGRARRGPRERCPGPAAATGPPVGRCVSPSAPDQPPPGAAGDAGAGDHQHDQCCRRARARARARRTARAGIDAGGSRGGQLAPEGARGRPLVWMLR